MIDSDIHRERYEALWRDLWANTHAGGPLARTRYRLALRWLKFEPTSSDRVLDVGAGNGAFMLAALSRSPHLDIRGAEYSQAAIDLAHPLVRERLARCDLQGDLPLPWGGGFQVITCMEVLEHLPDDTKALAHIAGALEPGGRLFISVPAWQSNWGPQDEAAGHVRRYEPAVLRARIEGAGLRVKRMKCWGGPLTWLYLGATDAIGPQTVMRIRPQGPAGLAAAGIYHILKIDDLLPLPRAPQLLALAETPG